MMYLWLKYIHIMSATILFGTGIGTASVMLYGHFTQNIPAMAVINQYVVKCDWLFTGISGILQPISGLGMVFLGKYSLKTPWILGSILAYIITMACWFIVVYLQIKIKNITLYAAKTNRPLPVSYYNYFKWWFIFGCPALISLMLIFYWMVMKSL